MLSPSDHVSDFITKPANLFKLDWVIMSIVILCLIAMMLYGIINAIEKYYFKKR